MYLSHTHNQLMGVTYYKLLFMALEFVSILEHLFKNHPPSRCLWNPLPADRCHFFNCHSWHYMSVLKCQYRTTHLADASHTHTLQWPPAWLCSGVWWHPSPVVWVSPAVSSHHPSSVPASLSALIQGWCCLFFQTQTVWRHTNTVEIS